MHRLSAASGTQGPPMSHRNPTFRTASRTLTGLPALAAVVALLAILATPSAAVVTSPTMTRWEGTAHHLWWEHVADDVSPWHMSASVQSAAVSIAAGVPANEPGDVDPAFRVPGTTVVRWSAWRTTCHGRICVDRHKRATLRLPLDAGSHVLTHGLEVWLPVTTVHTRVSDGRVLRVLVSQERLHVRVMAPGITQRHRISSDDGVGRRLYQDIHTGPVHLVVTVDGLATSPRDAGYTSTRTWVTQSTTHQ